MGSKEESSRSTHSNINEPGAEGFKAEDFPSIRKLLNDPDYGRGTGSTLASDKYSIFKYKYEGIGDRHGEIIWSNKKLSGFDHDLLSQYTYVSIQYKDQFEKYGVYDFLGQITVYESQLLTGQISDDFNAYVSFLLQDKNKGLLANIIKVYPRLEWLIDAYVEIANYQVESLGGEEAILEDLRNNYMRAFGDYESAIDFKNTSQLVQEWFHERDNVPPAAVNPWEMRIGASRFFVPPISVDVSQQFKVGSLAGGALRSPSTPKFNSGHSETVINITLYFPNHESIWGYYGTEGKHINFDDKNVSEVEIDRFISSLRGLITQFKYAPFLPVKNEYLNKAHDISAVTLHSMSLNTIPGFPFCVAVNLQMLKFNWKPYLQPITDFHQAVHWGRYRQYVGRAAQKLNSIVNEGFLVEKTLQGRMPKPIDPITGKVNDDVGAPENPVVIRTENDPIVEFNKIKDFEDGRFFRLYYPKSTPAKVFAPDTSDFRQPGENISAERQKNFWELFLAYLGVDVNTNPEATYDRVTKESTSGLPSYGTERDKIKAFLGQFTHLAEVMTEGKLEEYIGKVIREKKDGTSPDEIRREIKKLWFDIIWESWDETPFFQDYLQNSQIVGGNYLIKEWMVPMDEVKFDWSKIIIEGINVNLANNIVRLQLQMEQEPVHQHIGGRDSSVEVSMLIFGEEELVKFRRLFEHVTSLARLEHAHGVLGFLGIKNVLTALAGIKYVLPLTYDVETIPNYPHVYRVTMSMVDFDIFQQKREELSSAQQQQLVEAFGKRNPFLRIKQLWGAFNAYPDFPLSVRDDDDNIVGHLDPDFYFRAYEMYDAEIYNWRLQEDDVENIDPIRARINTINDILKSKKDPSTGLPLSNGHTKRLIMEREELRQSAPTEASGDYFGIKYDNEHTLQSKTYHDHIMTWAMGPQNEEQSRETIISMRGSDISVGALDAGSKTLETGSTTAKITDDTPDRTLTQPTIDGLSAFSEHQSPHADAGTDPAKHWELMMTDAAYRDISGRMVRAFPTYMLWLIDEGGRFAGVKLFDNFYGLQSVIDFSLARSEDVLGDTLVLRLSNLYQKLSTPYANYLFKDQGAEEENKSIGSFIDILRDRNRNMRSGTDDRYMVYLENIRLKPGVRLHLRAGYSANPNSLKTIFNGTITEVRSGDIMEVVAQSDAIELSPYINTTNKDGHSGDAELGGGINTGLWMSEPRDLMVRLLSMGSSTFRESLAHATKGMIFSENKFGIRHFGQILYEPLSDEEKVKQERRYNVSKSALDDILEAGPFPTPELGGAVAGAILPGSFDALLGNASARTPMLGVMQNMWHNFLKKRDYEIFKRNIYPGNGTGIHQFLGADSLDGGVTLALAYNADGSVSNQTSPAGITDSYYSEGVKNAALAQSADTLKELEAVGESQEAVNNGEDPVDPGVLDNIGVFGSLTARKENSPILKALGLVGDVNDDDMKGYDEVTFRAQTYMKTIWDIFQLCAALLPNYIVAVRPFEDRSTIFYGKPHWMYTSGLIPITTGIKPTEGPKLEGVDEELAKLKREALNEANAFADYEAQARFFQNAGEISPYVSNEGIRWDGDINSLPLNHESGIYLVARSGKIGIEMHLPTSGDAEVDKQQHKQLPDLPVNRRHPAYMDKEGGGKGGIKGYNPDDEDVSAPGATGAFGYLDPEVEQWYMNMPWGYAQRAGNGPNPYYQPSQRKSMYDPKNGVKKVLIYAPETGRACVCAIGEFGPSASVIRSGIIAGASPDVMHVLGIDHGAEVQFGFMPDDTPLGPAQDNTVDSSMTGAYAEGTPVEDMESFMTLEEFEAIKDSFPMGAPNLGGPITFDEDEMRKLYEMTTSEGGERGKLLRSLEIPSGIASKARNNQVLLAYEFGAFTENAPVWIAPSNGAQIQSGAIDLVGIAARRLYDRDYNAAFEKNAYGVDFSGVGSGTSSYDVSSNFTVSGGHKGSGGRTLKQAIQIWHEFREGSGFFQFDLTKKIVKTEWPEGELENEDQTVNSGPAASGYSTYGDKEQREVIARFMRFMWQEPYARAWLVITTNRTHDATSFNNTFDIDADDLGLGGNNDAWDFEQSPVMDLFRYFLVTHTRDGFDKRDPATGKYVDSAVSQRNKLLAWMAEHNAQGKDSATNLERAVENLGTALDQSVGQIWKAISAGLSGLTALYRISMMQLGHGLDSVNSMQKQANVLNRVFNDSIYYSAGSPGDIMRLADNPFTREYGEPVVEIREPFQKMHYLSSWQHILSNNITENLSDVPTVITATSDGSYPVTVYFDRGAPPERQVERMVETGLFWDNARGSGFFGFLHPLLHPIETARGIIKNATGTPDELTSKRVALYHLKEGLKDIYGGEVVVLGNPDIEPHDLVYLADVYERMYGIFEVEQVVHHFTPEMGFITSITPNALVTINDPVRWGMLSWVQSWFNVKNMRDDVRVMLHHRGKENAPLFRDGEITLDELGQALETQMLGHLQYAHGNSALIRDLASAAMTGNLISANRPEPKKSDVSVGSIAGDLVRNLPGVNIISDLLEGPWNWVKDNLIDQQGCYIQYLNKDGQPMDAGLSYNQGVAVGRHHSKTLLPGILGLNIEVTKDGNTRITSNDLLDALGWNEIEVNSVQRDISFWVAQTNAQILRAAGKSPDKVLFGPLDAEIVTVKDGYFDGDTFHSTDGREWRLAGVSAPEILHTGSATGPNDVLPIDATDAMSHAGYRAAAFVRKRLYEDPVAMGHSPTVAVRSVTTDQYGRNVAVVFHNVPAETAADQRDEVLLKIANHQPVIEWDSYMTDGRPHTINWEVIAAGLAQTMMFDNRFDTERGVIGTGRG